MSHTFRLKRHADDEYEDRVVFSHENDLLIFAQVLPRWKESELSGDEWRTSVCVDGLLLKRGTAHYSKMVDMFLRLPGKIVRDLEADTVFRSPIKFEVFRKGHCLFSAHMIDIVTALTSAYEAYLQADDDSRSGLMLSLEQEREVCQQPGCCNKPAIIYRLKKEFCTKCGKVEEDGWRSHLAKRDDAMQMPHIWFCKEHAERGDCGIEDSDQNYEKVGELGQKETN